MAQIQVENDWWLNYYDSGYEWVVDQLRPKQLLDEQVDRIVQALSDAGVTGGRLLDAPCAGGAVSVALAQSSAFEVVGLDISGDMISIARRRAFDADCSTATFQHCDIRKMSGPPGFSAAINWFTSLGYTTNPEDDIAMLSGIRETLISGGVLLVEVDVLPDAGQFVARDYVLDLQQGGVIATVAYDPESQIIKELHQIDTPFGLVERSMQIRLYTREELTDLVAAAGFEDIEVAVDPAAPGSTPRALVRARKR